MSDAPFSPRQACFGRNVAAGAVGSLGQLGYQSSYMGLATPPASVGLGQYSQFCAPAAADASESGVTFSGCPGQKVAPRKRRRADQPPVLGGTADVAAHAHQQLMDVDRLVLHHAAKMWAELAEQRRRHARQMVGAVEAAAAKRLRAKDEEIDRIGTLNWALEERLKSIYVEAQVWRDLAQSNEAAVNALRGELEQALDAQARCGSGGADAAGDDAESCCCGENDVASVAGEEEAGTTVERRGTGRGRCKGCGEGAAVVLLLPCRHLCACAPCAATARACPACGCAKNGSVCVNFS